MLLPSLTALGGMIHVGSLVLHPRLGSLLFICYFSLCTSRELQPNPFSITYAKQKAVRPPQHLSLTLGPLICSSFSYPYVTR